MVKVRLLIGFRADLYPHVPEFSIAGHTILRGEAELGDSVHEDPAGLVEGLEDRDLVPEAAEVGRAGQPRGATGFMPWPGRSLPDVG